MKKLLFLIWLGLSISAEARMLNPRIFNEQDGLPSNHVFSVSQDKHGFYWIATAGGLLQTNGTYKKIWTVNDGLTTNEILSVFIDSKNRVWCNTIMGATKYIQNGVVKTLNPNLNRTFQNISAIGEDNGNLWFSVVYKSDLGNENSVFCVNVDVASDVKKVDNVKKYVLFSNERHPIYIFQDKKFTFSKVPYLSSELVYISNPDSLKYKGFVPLISKHPSSRVIGCLLHEHGSQLINKDGSFGYFFKSNRIHRLISTDKEDEFWACTDNEILLVSPRKVQLVYKSKEPINGIYHDFTGGIWMTTLTDGLYYFSKGELSQINTPTLPSIANIVTSIGNSPLFLCRGNNVFDFNGDVVTKFPSSRSSERILGIASFKKGWFLVGDGGIYDQVHNKLVYLGASKGVLKLNDSTFLVPTYESFRKCMFRNGAWEIEVLKVGRTFNCRRINNRIYICNSGGIFYCELNNLKDWFPFLENSPTVNYSCLLNGNDGRFWAGSNAGIFVIQGGKIIMNITEKQGLLNNNVLSLSLDPKNNMVLVGTDEGCSIFKENNTRLIQNLNSFEGIPTNGITAITVDEKQVYLGTEKGLFIFKIGDVKNNRIFPYILKPLINIDGGIVDDSSIVVPAGAQNIQLRFFDPLILIPGRLGFRYKIKELDKEFHELDRPQLTIQRLDPGSYTLIFQYYDKGNPDHPPYEYQCSIEKLPFFYQKSGFIAVVVLLTLGIVILISIKIIKILRVRDLKELEREKMVASLRLDALKAQMNPHFIFNCLSVIKSFVYHRENEEAERYITIFSRMIRSTLDMSRQTTTTLSQEIYYLKNYLQLEQMRNPNIHFIINCSIQDHKLDEFEIPTLLVQPFVENAARHAFLPNTKGEIVVSFYEIDSILEIKIEDNGIGIDNSITSQKDKMHTSHALNILKEKLQIFKQSYNTSIDIKITDKKEMGGCGTLIVLNIKQEFDESSDR